MSDPKETEKQPAARAETARQEGAQGRSGKTSVDTVSDGAIDASDPNIAAEVTEIADQVHANA